MILYWSSLFFFLLLYGILISIFAFGWYNTPLFNLKENEGDELAFISVIIAVRNEEKNIQKLLSTLTTQNYPSDRFEVLLINDHSEDQTLELIKLHSKDFKNIRSFNALPDSFGKKAAISYGIKIAKGELLVLTDADCILKPDWLCYYNGFFQYQNKPDMIIGLVDITPILNVFQKCFRLDFLSLITSSTGAAYVKHPFLNNSANLGIKKNSIDNTTDLKTEIASGDDVFLLHDFKRKNKTISVLKANEHIVNSAAPERISDFINQRIRWASKAGYYSDRDSLFVSWLVFLSNLFLFSSYIVAPLTNSFLLLLSAFLLKSSFDFIIFLSCKSYFKLDREMMLIPIIEVFYPIYIVFTAMRSAIKPFQWKGRKVL